MANSVYPDQTSPEQSDLGFAQYALPDLSQYFRFSGISKSSSNSPLIWSSDYMQACRYDKKSETLRCVVVNTCIYMDRFCFVDVAYVTLYKF